MWTFFKMENRGGKKTENNMEKTLTVFAVAIAIKV